MTHIDVHEIQLAKAAIRCGLELLCEHNGILPEQIDSILIAGAFGSHLDTNSAVEIGMFPDVDLSRYHAIGNAAGIGAREMLINQGQRKFVEDLAGQISTLELNTHPLFNDMYVKALYLERNANLDAIL